MDRSHTALILDGSLGHGCVALLAVSGPRSGDLVVAESGEPQRSHLERIATLLPSEASRAELSAIVVGVGPGSYTGIRAASAAAAGVGAARMQAAAALAHCNSTASLQPRCRSQLLGRNRPGPAQHRQK